MEMISPSLQERRLIEDGFKFKKILYIQFILSKTLYSTFFIHPRPHPSRATRQNSTHVSTED